LVCYGVAEFERIFSVAVKQTIVNVDRLSDGKTFASWNTVASSWVAGGRTPLIRCLITQPSPTVIVINMYCGNYTEKNSRNPKYAVCKRISLTKIMIKRIHLNFKLTDVSNLLCGH